MRGKNLAQIYAEIAKGWREKNYPRIIYILKSLLRDDPRNEKLLLDLGFAYAWTFDFSAAAECFEHAVSASRVKAYSLLRAGDYWATVRCYEEARCCFERALQQRDVPVEVFVRLAEIYEREKKLEEAKELIVRACRLAPSDGLVLLARARVCRQRGEIDEAEKILRSLLSDARQLPLHSRTGYELGTLLDRQGRYDEAWDSFLKAKHLANTQPGIENAKACLRALQASMAEMPKTIPPERLKQWRNFGKAQLHPARKLALLAGHPRSGTTLLEYVLDSHPSVISLDETLIFSNTVDCVDQACSLVPSKTLRHLDSTAVKTFRQVREDYIRGAESFSRQTIGESLLLDKNPALTASIPVFLRFFPESKFLVTLRDPRDVCLSCFMQYGSMCADTSAWLTLKGTIDNYAAIMGFWLELKPRLGDIALEVRYEDMVSDLETHARRTLDFLGLSWNERVLKFNEHARDKMVRSPTYAEVKKPLYKSAIGRWRNYEKHFEPHLKTLEPFLQAFGYD